MKKCLLFLAALPFMTGCFVTDLAGLVKEPATLEGFERLEVYRYKGAQADPSDFQREIIYRRVEAGAAVFEPASDAVTVETVEAAPVPSAELEALADEVLKEFAEELDTQPKKKEK